MKILKKAIPIFLTSVLICSLQVPIRAESLDEVLNTSNQVETTQEQEVIPTPEPIKKETPAVQENDEQSGKGYNFIDDLQKIDLQEDKLIVNDRNVTEEVNNATYKVSATITQILAYAIFCLIAVRAMLDCLYISIPFSRGFLNPNSQGPQMMGGPQPQMNSFKQDKDTQNGSKDQMAGAGNQRSNVQWISNSAMMAASQQTPWRIYFKDTIILWIGLGILTVLILTGSLTDLGFLIGEAIQKAIETLKF